MSSEPVSSELVTYELDGSVAIVGLNRPDKRNAISDAVIDQLRAALLRAGDEANAGVLFGHGSNFSAGLDLAEALAKRAPDKPRPRKGKRHTWHEVFDLVARGSIPWVAALHGPVLGGGLELACAAHIRVADEKTFFGLPEGQRGIFVGGGGTVRIQRIVGFTVMADMMLTGRLLTAQEGERVGLARYLVPVGQSLAKAKELAAKIAQNTHDTNWMITNILPRANDLSHDDALFLEYMNANLTRNPEAAERLRTFVEGRAKPLVAPGATD
jgi:(methylthio)acryloyl-CoA hydratase